MIVSEAIPDATRIFMLLSDVEGSPEGENCLAEDKAFSVPVSGGTPKKSVVDCLY
ncbi:hypothetical protein [Thioalkalivibrio sp.]|uniref:hypothetical protein n=1 Tax=Thioalkalivibrio sp. TaxID=2093813 RepID=UPI0025DB64F5|nr:hypothetical protein [Thioalkalivibrio sp.]